MWPFRRKESEIGSSCTEQENVRLQACQCPNCGAKLRCISGYDWNGQTVICDNDRCAASFQIAEPFGVRIGLKRLSAPKRASTG